MPQYIMTAGALRNGIANLADADPVDFSIEGVKRPAYFLSEGNIAVEQIHVLTGKDAIRDPNLPTEKP